MGSMNPFASVPTPTPTAAPTAAEIAAKEPDKEKLRRQRLAAMLAQGRASAMDKSPTMPATQSTTLGGSSGSQTLGA
jgi:hypothetical protein